MTMFNAIFAKEICIRIVYLDTNKMFIKEASNYRHMRWQDERYSIFMVRKYKSGINSPCHVRKKKINGDEKEVVCEEKIL